MASGFKLMVEDRGSLGSTALQTYTDTLVDKGQQVPKMIVVPTMFRAETPQLYMDVSRTKARSLGVPIEELDNAVQTYLGSAYIGNFNAFGRYWQVNIQADGGVAAASRGPEPDLHPKPLGQHGATRDDDRCP